MRQLMMWRVVCVLLSMMALHCSSGYLYGQTSNDILEQARQNGIDYLKEQQQPDGSWEWEEREVSITALCTLALLENGLSERDPVVEKGMRFVRRNIKKNEQTDAIVYSILLFSRIGREGDKSLVKTLTERLMAGKSTTGGWDETCPLTKPNKRDKPNDSLGDNRSTQLAVMGLWVASQSGVKVGDVMTDVALRFLKTQNEDGGWGETVPKGLKLHAEVDLDKKTRPDNAQNNPDETIRFSTDKKEATTGSMTFASLFCLTVSKATRPQKRKGRGAIPEEILDDSGTLIENPIFKKGLTAAAEHLKISGTIVEQTKKKVNPNPDEFAGDPSLTIRRTKEPEPADDSPYFLWMVERLGVLIGQETFGEINWFDKGAKLLIDTQQEDGSWSELDQEEKEKKKKGEQNSLHDTAFAILFLRKATIGSNASQLLNSKPENKFQIVTQPEKPRFSTLKQAVAASKKDDTIRIDGNGPFKMPHLVINHNLNIQAGFGYEPVMNYDEGFDKNKMRIDPARDDDSRYLMKAKKGTLTLEGLRMEMDLPKVDGNNIIWNAIRVNGGNLRLLNCQISEGKRKGMEGNRKGMAAISIEKPGTVVVKNCLFIAGRACFEVEGNGKQHIEIINSLLFSNTGIQFFDRLKEELPDVSIMIKQATFQCAATFPMKSFNGSTAFTSINSLYKVEDLGGSMLQEGFKKTGRSWGGGNNVYNTSKWVGADGKMNPAVKDVNSWHTFWDKKEIKPDDKRIDFASARNIGSFNHTLKPSDWYPEKSPSILSMRPRRGMQSTSVGAGSKYSKFRNSIQYNHWKKIELSTPSSGN